MSTETESLPPEFLLLSLGDALIDFLREYNPAGRFSTYDYEFLSRVLYVMCPIFQYQHNFDQALSQFAGWFSHPSLIYSDETYNPNKTVQETQRLAQRLRDQLIQNNVYGKWHDFPYAFHRLEKDFTIVFKRQHHISFLVGGTP